MSWTEKKISLPSFLGSNDKHAKSQDDTSGVKAKEENKILKCAVLKKIKKNHQFSKKFFVLYDRTSTSPAKLVYHDSEKKHLAKLPPKREIVLEKCFNINRKQDYLDKNGKKVMALILYTLDDCVQISYDEREDELNEWLEAMLVLQQGSSNFYGKKPRPTFDIIWQVNVKGFRPDDGNDTRTYQWTGPHRLCVTTECALLYPLGEEKCVELPHPCIRNIMYNDKLKVLGLELGRTSPIGSGMLSLESEEKECVSQVHEILRKAMIGATNHKDILGLSGRYRSSSLSQDRGSKPRGIPHISSGKTFRDREYLSRNRTISEPVGEAGKPGTVTPESGTTPRPRPMSMRYSPGILSPTSPVGSVSAGLSDDGTGSSNSINDTTCTGDLDPHYSSYPPEVIPEESSGEVSIEFKRESSDKVLGRREGGEVSFWRKDLVEDGNSSLPRKQRMNVFHKKQPSLPDYMPMVPPPLPARNQEYNLSTSLPTGAAPKVPPCIASPTDSQKSSSFSSDCHLMSGLGSTQQSTPLISPDNNYLPMDLIYQIPQSTPVKSSQTQTLVHNQTFSPHPSHSPYSSHHPVHPANLSYASTSHFPVSGGGGYTSPAPAAYRSMTSPRSFPLLESAASPRLEVLTVLTPPPDQGGKKRNPSGGEGGYVVMSPGVPLNLENSINEEPASLAQLEESLGGRWPTQSSPRHSSPVTRRRSRMYPDSQRNSSCLEDTPDSVWGWRLNEDADKDFDDFGDQIGRSPVGPLDDYMLLDYPRIMGGSTPRPISRVSPASSSSAMSGTPSSCSRLNDIDRLVLRDETEEDKVTSRPPRGEVKKWGRHIDIPSSKSSSRSNISPFGRTPPSGASGSPTVASRLVEGWFRHRAGSVPNRPPLQERRRHRTQSEGEKDANLTES